MTIYFASELSIDDEDAFLDLTLLMPLTRTTLESHRLWDGRAKQLFPGTGEGFLTAQDDGVILPAAREIDEALLARLFPATPLDELGDALEQTWGRVVEMDEELVDAAHQDAWDGQLLPRHYQIWSRYWGDGEINFVIRADYVSDTETANPAMLAALDEEYTRMRGNDERE